MVDLEQVSRRNSKQQGTRGWDITQKSSKPAQSRLTACKLNARTVCILHGLARISNSFNSMLQMTVNN